MIISDEWVGICKEEIVVYFRVLPNISIDKLKLTVKFSGSESLLNIQVTL
jgi:hypothetical protein